MSLNNHAFPGTIRDFKKPKREPVETPNNPKELKELQGTLSILKDLKEPLRTSGNLKESP